MAERLRNMADGPSPDVNPTPAQVPSEQKVGVQSTKGPAWRSPDFDPKREDYEARGVDPVTGKKLDYYSYIDPLTDKEVARIPRIEGGAVSPVDMFVDAEPSDSQAKNIIDTQKYLSQRDTTKLSPARLAEYQVSVDRNRQNMAELINRAQASGVLNFVRSDLKTLYISATERSGRSSYFSAQSETGWQTELRSIAEGNYKEAFWDYGYDVLRNLNLGEAAGPVDVVALRAEFESLPNYIASKVALSIEKFTKGIPLSPGTEIGDLIFEGIRRERAREVTRGRARATADEMLEYSDWRERFDFNWAQTRPELEASVFAWLEKFVAHLPDATIEEINTESLNWKRNAISALEKAANRLHISEKEPFYKELKGTIEGHVEVFRGVKFLENDGLEAHTIALEEFSHNFNEKHDAIILGNEKSAIIQAFLARNHGAIAMGAPGTLEKPQAGDIEDFRGKIEEQAKLYAATHELYIKEADFESAIVGEKEIRAAVALLGLNHDVAEERVKTIIEERKRNKENRRYGWDDEIEQLLLSGGDRATATAAGDIQALMRMDIRSQVFQGSDGIKDRLDKDDEARDGRSFDLLSPDERREEIRFRIRAKMVLTGYENLARDIDATTDLTARDSKLWDWLKQYNENREKQGHSLFFPSNWDTVRLSINKSTKLVDRALSEQELEAMIEEVSPFSAVVGGVTVTLKIDGLTDEEIKAEVDALPALNDIQRKELLEDALFDKQQREAEAERALNINRAYQKFLGVDARWGGMAVRVLNDDGDIVLKNVWEIAEEILKAKIDTEAGIIEAQVIAHETALRAQGILTNTQIEEAITQRRRLLRRDSTFGATLALREIGIANDLPIWNYYYYNDPQRIQTFAPLVGYTHNDKVELVDLLDRGRREMRAVFDYLADTYMDGRVLIVRDIPNSGVDQNGQPNDFHQERWDRARVINEAGMVALREVFESRFMLSTSGGIEVVDLISKIGDLGIYDLLWEMGCKDFREFQGFIKRRDEVELKKQSFWNIRQWRDPVTYAKRLRGAGAAIPFLRGGEVKGQGRKPGVLQEPMMGAYKYRDELLDTTHWISSEIKNNIEQKRSTFREELQKTIENDDNFKNITVQEQDRLVEVGAGILVTLIEYMDALRYKMNRAGLAPKNWKFDNELIFRHYVKELLKRESLRYEVGEKMSNGEIAKGGELKQPEILGGAEKLGADDLGYAVQGRSKLAIKVFEAILRTSSYHILVEKDRKVFDKKGRDVKEARDAERVRIAALPLPTAIQTRFDKRRDKLVALHTSQTMIDTEITRLNNQYIDEELERQFVGEWAAKLAEVAL